MSLEEKIDNLVDAITGHTDAIQHLTAVLRGGALPGAMSAGQAQLAAVKTQIAAAETANPNTPADPAETAAAGKPRGRPPKKTEPPASPAETAAKANTSQAGSAPAANAGLYVELTYDDLVKVVPQIAEKHGRSKAVEILAKFGLTSGRQLLEDEHKSKIGDVVRAFRAAL